MGIIQNKRMTFYLMIWKSTLVVELSKFININGR